MPAVFWLGLCVLGIAPYALLIARGSDDGITFHKRDFDCLWVAARLVLEGRLADVYDIEAFRAAMLEMLPLKKTQQIYSYPPHGLFIALPFGLLPHAAAFVAWTAASLGLFFWAARPYLRAVPWWVALLAPATIICLNFGQYGLIVAALWLWAFAGHGWAAAALTFKPHLGFLTVVPMLRDRKALAVAVGGTLVLIAASALVFGPASWRAFVQSSLAMQAGRVISQEGVFHVMQVTAMANYGWAVHLLFAGAAGVLLLRCFNVFTAATATFLIAPYGFHYDMPAACLGFAFLIATRWDAMPPWQKLAACFGFIAPGLTLIGAWVVPPLLLAGLYVQVIQGRAALAADRTTPTAEPPAAPAPIAGPSAY